MTVVVDTSVFYAAFNTADPRHKSARAELGRPAGVRVPLAVLVEFLGLVQFRHGGPAAHAAWEDLSALGTVEVVQPQEPGHSMRIWRGGQALSLADAVGIQEALASGLPLLTYDKTQGDAWRRLAKG